MPVEFAFAVRAVPKLDCADKHATGKSSQAMSLISYFFIILACSSGVYRRRAA